MLKVGEKRVPWLLPAVEALPVTQPPRELALALPAVDLERCRTPLILNPDTPRVAPPHG